MYRTGDIVRYIQDGLIEFKGRNDLQVKLHGFRIELEEIEAVLRQHPAIQGAIVQVISPTDEEDPSLVAYLVSNRGASLQRSEIIDFLRKQLPEYMLPAHIVHLAAFPLTAHGKIDRLQLSPPKAEGKRQRECIPPTGSFGTTGRPDLGTTPAYSPYWYHRRLF